MNKKLVTLITDPKNMAEIWMPETPADNPSLQLLELSRDLSKPLIPCIINTGSYYGSCTTFFYDPQTKQNYILLNKEVYTPEDRRTHVEEGHPLPEVGFVSKGGFIPTGTLDKSPTDRIYFFDASMRDVFVQLGQAGIKFDSEVKKEYNL
jgi:hypothetical protein